LCEADTQFECQLGKAFMLAENGLRSFCALGTDAGSFCIKFYCDVCGKQMHTNVAHDWKVIDGGIP
jgi:hypothetical protein